MGDNGGGFHDNIGADCYNLIVVDDVGAMMHDFRPSLASILMQLIKGKPAPPLDWKAFQRKGPVVKRSRYSGSALKAIRKEKGIGNPRHRK